MVNSRRYTIAWKAAIALLPLTLGACGLLGGEKPPPAPAPKPKRHAEAPLKAVIEETIRYPADAYLLHLSLAKLALQTHPSTPAATAADLDIVRDFSAQTPSRATAKAAVIIEYSLKGQSRHDFIAIPLPLDSLHYTIAERFLDLEQAMLMLNALSYTLYDVKPAMVSLPAPTPFDEESDAVSTLRMIDAHLQPAIKSAVPLPPLQQAQSSLQLTRFFMSHQSQQPAYLSIENAKQAIAAAGGDPDANRLFQQIEAQETVLHQKMPFTLGF